MPKPLTRPSATLSPSDGERDRVRGFQEIISGNRNCPTLAIRRISRVVLCSVVLLAFSGLAGIQPFRFAFLSDTHVGSLSGEEDLRATVRDINSLTGLSFVVLSGDVTEYGSREQLRLASNLVSYILSQQLTRRNQYR